MGMFGSLMGGAAPLAATAAYKPQDQKKPQRKVDWGQALGVIGAGLKDLDGTMGRGNLDRATQQIQTLRQDRERQARLDEALSKIKSPELRRLAELNPGAYASQALAAQFRPDRQEQGASVSRYVVGDDGRYVAMFNDGSSRVTDITAPQEQDTGGGNVQSTFTDKDGFLNYVTRGGEVVNTGRQVRNPYQIVDNGGVPTAVDRQTGQALPITTAQTVGQNKAAIESEVEEAASQRAAIQDWPSKRDSITGMLSNIERLMPERMDEDGNRIEAGDLNDGFQKAYGARVPFGEMLPGARGNAGALVDQLTGKMTLEEAQQLAGVLSDSDIKLLNTSSTRLANRNLTDDEALKALTEVHTMLSNRLETARERVRGGRPDSIAPEDWEFLTPEERALWRQGGAQ